MIVSMDEDHESLYLNLDNLLKDICRFLETNSKNLSSADKKKALSLIDRSKKQLQIIEKISIEKENKTCIAPIIQLLENAEINNENPSERYVDMSKNTGPPKKPIIPESEPHETKCPFQDLPAKEASQEIKYGTLSKRRRVLNILDVSTKVYAAIHENWLLVYGSSKDPKPDCALDLKYYEAKEDECDPNFTQLEITRDDSLKKNNLNIKLTSSFKVFNSGSSEKKSYSFVAITHKDMLQWVVNINRRHDKAVLVNKPIQEEQNYEICEEIQKIEEENIYNEIEIPCRFQSHSRWNERSVPDEKIPGNDDPPAIPERKPIGKPLENILPNIAKSLSSESMVSYEDLEQDAPIKKTFEKCSLDSFESSGEDQTYYELDTVTIETKVNQIENQTESIIAFDVPPPSIMPTEISSTMNDSEELTYENNLNIQPTQLSNKNNDLKSTTNQSPPTAKRKLPDLPLSGDVNTSPKPALPDKIVSKPLTLKSKPWKSFTKNLSNKNLRSPQITKNKPIRESLKSSINLENPTVLEISSSKNRALSREISPSKEVPLSKEVFQNKEVSANKEVLPSKGSPPSSNNNSSKTIFKETLDTKESSIDNDCDSSNTPNEILLPKTHQGGNIVQIIRSRWSPSRSTSCSLETFSKNTKIETFQATLTKETPSKDFLRNLDKNLKDSLRQIDSQTPDLDKKCVHTDKPIILLKPSLEDENTLKKIRKSPEVPVKPKKVAKKLAF